MDKQVLFHCWQSLVENNFFQPQATRATAATAEMTTG